MVSWGAIKCMVVRSPGEMGSAQGVRSSNRAVDEHVKMIHLLTAESPRGLEVTELPEPCRRAGRPHSLVPWCC